MSQSQLRGCCKYNLIAYCLCCLYLDGVLEQRYADVTIAPVSITYDRLVENEAHVDELSGGRKRAERYAGLSLSLSS
jgi:glycerol-3-phosphate O-acyltransferase